MVVYENTDGYLKVGKKENFDVSYESNIFTWILSN